MTGVQTCALPIWPAEFLLKNQLITLWGFPCKLFVDFPLLLFLFILHALYILCFLYMWIYVFHHICLSSIPFCNQFLYVLYCLACILYILTLSLFPFSFQFLMAYITFWPAKFLLKNQLITLWGFPCRLFVAFPLLHLIFFL